MIAAVLLTNLQMPSGLVGYLITGPHIYCATLKLNKEQAR
jgi:hypothetical protein